MTLTKRLYRLDEVRSAFLYCLKTKQMEHSLFWLRELEESCYGGEARRLLFLGWFLSVGLSRVQWLYSWSQEGATKEGRFKLCWQLIKCPEKDSSLWWFLGSILQKKDEELWELVVNGVDDERLDCIMEALQTDMRSYSIFAKCAAFMIFSKMKELPKTTWQELSQKEPQIQLTNDTSLRTSRIYEIPYECLFGMTWRGSGQNTMEELNSLSLETLSKSPYWKKLVADCNNDESIEAFWDIYFAYATCDHPNEWPLSLKKKSHGEGSTGAQGPLSRWWRNWIYAEPPFVSKSLCKTILKGIETLPGNTDGSSVLDRVTIFQNIQY